MTTNNPIHQTRVNFGNTDTYVRRDGSDMKFKDGNNSEVTLTDLQSGGGAGSGGAFAQNLSMENNSTNPDYQIDFTADNVGMLDSTTGAATLRNVSDTFDISTDLDTGSESSSTWYYLWIVSTNGTSITSTVVSASASSPTGLSASDYRLRIASIYNDSSSNFRRINKSGKYVTYYDNTNDKMGHQVASGDTSETWTSISLSAYIPSYCYRCSGSVRNRGGNLDLAMAASPQALDTTNPFYIEDGVPGFRISDSSVSSQSTRVTNRWTVNIQTAQTIYWMSNNTTTNEVRLISYLDDVVS